ncbi:MAG: ABC transporter substrate-binding protein, partial [Chloroflexota bacterium]
MPLTGPQAELSKDNRLGWDAYLDSINRTVAGRKIEDTWVDDANKPDVGLTKAKQLVESEHVQLLAGVFSTPVAYAIAGYVKDAHVPVAITGQAGATKLLIDAKFKSPYLFRLTVGITQASDPMADYIYKQGHRKAILMSSDFGGGLEYGDGMASAFVARGGSIIQELHPAFGSTDFGPFLAQLNPDADVLLAFLVGADAVRFVQQYATYSGPKKLQIAGPGEVPVDPRMMKDTLKDNAVGLIESTTYTEAIDTPENKAFLQAFHKKYPDAPAGENVTNGYTGAETIVAALNKIDGNIENPQAFIDVLTGIKATTARGPIAFDQDHDTVQNIYLIRNSKQGSGYGQELLETYPNVSATFDRTIDQIQKFPFGDLKGNW